MDILKAYRFIKKGNGFCRKSSIPSFFQPLCYLLVWLLLSSAAADFDGHSFPGGETFYTADVAFTLFALDVVVLLT